MQKIFIFILLILVGLLSFFCVKVSSVADKATAYTYSEEELSYLKEKNSTQIALLKEVVVGEGYAEVKLITDNLKSEFDIVETPNQIFIGKLCIYFEGGVVTNIE